MIIFYVKPCRIMYPSLSRLTCSTSRQLGKMGNLVLPEEEATSLVFQHLGIFSCLKIGDYSLLCFSVFAKKTIEEDFASLYKANQIARLASS